MIKQATVTMSKNIESGVQKSIEGCILILKQSTDTKESSYVIPLLNPFNKSKRRSFQKKESKWNNINENIKQKNKEAESVKSGKPEHGQHSIKDIELRQDQDLQLYQSKSKIVLIGNTQLNLD